VNFSGLKKEIECFTIPANIERERAHEIVHGKTSLVDDNPVGFYKEYNR
jgi:hypothetical protein